MKTIEIEHMSLQKIADSGQCFTWRPLGEQHYAIEAFGTWLEVRQEGQRFTFSCSEEEFSELWSGYFDLTRDYGELKSRVREEDAYLKEALEFGGGIRILRQELWPVMVSFLISQNNNITRIRNSIRALQKQFGKPVEGSPLLGGEPCLTFPGPDELAAGTEADFRGAGLGYRAKYLAALAEDLKDGGLAQLQQTLDEADDDGAVKELTAYLGIGKKVADCICLFGLGRGDPFPVDTHIRQILDRHFQGGFPWEHYRGSLGIYQQYMFYYHLKTGR